MLLLPPVLLRATDVPMLTHHVTDLTGTLSAEQVNQLDSQLIDLEKRKGAQMVVLMVDSTRPQDIESYSLAVAEANKIGRKGTDDGVLVLIAKKDRRDRIEVGYGLEGAVPDAATARIRREYMEPRFRADDFYGGIRDGIGALTKLIDGEPLPPPASRSARDRPSVGNTWVLAVIVAIFLRNLFGRARTRVRLPIGATVTGIVLGLLALSFGGVLIGALIGGALMLLPGGGGRSIGGGGWGGFGGGNWGSGSGGGSGGGFSGGGGSFGGGGSSGSW